MKQLFKEFFYILTAAVSVFLIMELLVPGMVMAYINVNWVLILWLINGILLLILGDNNKYTK